MENSDYNILKDWMFGKLTSLLENTEPNPKYPILKMSLGEPTLGVPDFTKKILDLNYKDWAKYPPSEAMPSLGSPNDIFKIGYLGLGSVFSKRDVSFPNIQSFKIL